MEWSENHYNASIFDTQMLSIKEESYNDIAPDFSEEKKQIALNALTYLKPEHFKSLSIPPMQSFDEIVLNMNPLDDSEFIFKEVLCPGFGPVVTSGQKVLVNCVMYCENILEPFDSTVLRGKPYYMKTGLGEIIEGLEYALVSMKIKEISKFIIKWPCAFLKAGCPPRIPPKADICCYIELVKIIDYLQPVAANGEFPSVEDNFLVKIVQCENMLKEGKSLLTVRKFEDSIRIMRKALDILQSLPLKDEREQVKMEILLIAVAVTLSAVYNHCNKPELACVHCRLALRINPFHQKALLNFGRAKIRLNDFHGAEQILLTGIEHYPNEKAFSVELERLKSKEAGIAAREKKLQAIKELKY